jgi:hypothetical protein
VQLNTDRVRSWAAGSDPTRLTSATVRPLAASAIESGNTRMVPRWQVRSG